MSEYTLPADTRRDGDSSASNLDLRTDDGLRQALEAILRANSWDLPAGHALVAEIRHRAGRNVKHVASTTRVALDRGLVDDVLLAAWMVLRRHGENVLAAARPWAYVMSSAQRQVLDEVQAQQLLTNAASIHGRAREVLPRSVGSTSTDLATALRHEPRGAGVDSSADPRILPQVGRHEPLPLLSDHAEQERTGAVGEREPWFAAFITLLVEHGANQAVTVAAVDRLADLFAATYVGWWEWPPAATLPSPTSACPRISAAPSSPCWPAPAATGTTASKTACWPPSGLASRAAVLWSCRSCSGAGSPSTRAGQSLPRRPIYLPR